MLGAPDASSSQYVATVLATQAQSSQDGHVHMEEHHGASSGGDARLGEGLRAGIRLSEVRALVRRCSTCSNSFEVCVCAVYTRLFCVQVVLCIRHAYVLTTCMHVTLNVIYDAQNARNHADTCDTHTECTNTQVHDSGCSHLGQARSSTGPLPYSQIHSQAGMDG